MGFVLKTRREICTIGLQESQRLPVRRHVAHDVGAVHRISDLVVDVQSVAYSKSSRSRRSPWWGYKWILPNRLVR